MKLHSILFYLLVVAAIVGAYTLGRLGHDLAVTRSPGALTPSPVPSTAPAWEPRQRAEVHTPQGILRVEGAATLLPANSTAPE